MGWRGTLRAMGAAQRRASKQHERRIKAFNKAQISADAADAVRDWRAQIRELVSLHVDHTAPMDWQAVANRPAPPMPLQDKANEVAAQAALDAFRPSIVHALRGGSEKVRARLVDAVERARSDDEGEFRRAVAKHQQDQEEWSDDVTLARRLLAGDVAGERDVINEMQSLSDEGLIGSHINFRLSDEFIHAIVKVHDDDIVPRTRLKQLQSGRLSETAMPVGEFNELYQDYVCSVALRVGIDVLHLIPRAEVYVTCMAEHLDKRTGLLSDTAILSVRLVRATLVKLNLAHLDPSDAMGNFVHAMNFKRSSGFAPISPLQECDD